MPFDYRQVYEDCRHSPAMNPAVCQWCHGSGQKKVWRNVWVPDANIAPNLQEQPVALGPRVPTPAEIWIEEKTQELFNWIGEKGHVFLSRHPKFKKKLEQTFFAALIVGGIVGLVYFVIFIRFLYQLFTN